MATTEAPAQQAAAPAATQNSSLYVRWARRGRAIASGRAARAGRARAVRAGTPRRAAALQAAARAPAEGPNPAAAATAGGRPGPRGDRGVALRALLPGAGQGSCGAAIWWLARGAHNGRAPRRGQPVPPPPPPPPPRAIGGGGPRRARAARRCGRRAEPARRGRSSRPTVPPVPPPPPRRSAPWPRSACAATR
jgi:hypothetical protein